MLHFENKTDSKVPSLAWHLGSKLGFSLFIRNRRPFTCVSLSETGDIKTFQLTVSLYPKQATFECVSLSKTGDTCSSGYSKKKTWEKLEKRTQWSIAKNARCKRKPNARIKTRTTHRLTLGPQNNFIGTYCAQNPRHRFFLQRPFIMGILLRPVLPCHI